MTRTRALTVAAVLLSATGCAGSEAALNTPTSPSRATATSSSSSPSSGTIEPACPNPHGGLCLGELDAGTYRTKSFSPVLSYTVPPGWRNDEDLPGNFLLYRTNDPQAGTLGGNYLGIYQNVHAAAINCEEAAQPGIGQTPRQLVAWFVSVPGLVTSAPREVTVGGLRGYEVDLTLKPGERTCSYDQYSGIPLIIGNGVSDLHHVILHELEVRLVILAWEGGNVTLEITSVTDSITAGEYRAALKPIINSLRFAP